MSQKVRRGAAALMLVAVGAGLVVVAEQAAPAGPAVPLDPTGPVAVSAGDRVYTADQTSNTVTVINPVGGSTLGTVALGPARLDGVLGPLNTGQTGVHGLAASPDGRLLAAVSVTSGTVTLIETASNRVLATVAVGGSPHEPAFSPDGKEVWVALRAGNQLAVVDTAERQVVGHVTVDDGPSKVQFSADGARAYVNHIRSATVAVVDTHGRAVITRIGGLADPFGADARLAPEGTELWVAHKRAGKLSVVDLVAQEVTSILAPGPGVNHVAFARTPGGVRLAIVTVGGARQTILYRLPLLGGVVAPPPSGPGSPNFLVAIDHGGHEPHGVDVSPDGAKAYVALEKSDSVDVIDLESAKVSATLLGAQEPQALVYVPGAVPSGPGTDGLGRQGLGRPVANYPLEVPGGGFATVTVRNLDGVDMVQVAARGLRPDTAYTCEVQPAAGPPVPLLGFRSDAGGSVVQALAFTRFLGVYTAARVTPLS